MSPSAIPHVPGAGGVSKVITVVDGLRFLAEWRSRYWFP
jgi:hypothetical protein